VQTFFRLSGCGQCKPFSITFYGSFLGFFAAYRLFDTAEPAAQRALNGFFVILPKTDALRRLETVAQPQRLKSPEIDPNRLTTSGRAPRNGKRCAHAACHDVQKIPKQTALKHPAGGKPG
jgi:hypothetical protein